MSRTWNLWGDKRRGESWRSVLGQEGRRITITGLDTRGVESYGGRAHLHHRRTAGAGAVGEAQHLSKGMFQLYGGEREPFLQRGQEQQMVGAAIMQRQDREDHIVPFQTTSMWVLYLIGRGIDTWKAFGRSARFPSYVVWPGDVQRRGKKGPKMTQRGGVVDGLGHDAIPLGQPDTIKLDDTSSSRALTRTEVKARRLRSVDDQPTKSL